ncbi:PREDICTED: uncharacterized protein LOC109114395 [Nelumbo nucifera]|uniref:Uncharacterized protein LOC109114395 n=1 Tax=Nelumbo nucifera TaxID=4432 RepID=A0A1U8Q369_NELNU|nr:PREDICTED: uncharacterized protein LOC109114395 [Nelumbo nucifera]
MRSFTKNQEILRPAITRFAIAYLTLQSIYKQKQPLQSMFACEKWKGSNWSKHPEGVKVKQTIMFDGRFWPQVAFCVKTTLPIVVVLREVDSEVRPSMPYLYEMMDSAKEQIAFACGGIKSKYMPIWNKIDERWTPQLHVPLHAAGYYLNPQLRYEPNFSNDREVREGLFECMKRMIPDRHEHALVDCQLDMYDKALGDFGCDMAIDTRKR